MTGICVVVYVCVLALLRRARAIRPVKFSPSPVRRSHPPHLKFRGFASAAFQESGGYASDAIVNGKLVQCDGYETDWTWRATDGPPPPWSTGMLPLYFHKGNGADAALDEDLSLMRAAGATMYRFSCCWAKLQPERYGCLDGAQVDHLRHKLARVRAHGMVPMLTLVHFVCPRWFPGWHTDESVDLLHDFTCRISRALPPFADADGNEWWITLNEPNIATLHGYVIGTRPPGIKNIPTALRAYANMLRAHVTAAGCIRRQRISTICAAPAWNVSLFAAHSAHSIADESIATALDLLFNRSILNLLTRGHAWVGIQYIEGEAAAARPFLAINTYTQITTRCRSLFEEPDIDHEAQNDRAIHNDLRWDISLDHLWHVIESVHAHAPDAVIIITEHGIPDCSDTQRRTLLRKTNALLHRAPYVSGYLHWSFTRNAEWELSPHGNFGVVDVDFANDFRRTPNRSYHVIRSLWT